VETEEEKTYPCPCCGFLTMFGPIRHTLDTCPICGWEDDVSQIIEPDMDDGANTVSLNEARENYAKFGAIDEEALSYVRPPRPKERPPKKE
jgi:hypothetical protein